MQSVPGPNNIIRKTVFCEKKRENKKIMVESNVVEIMKPGEQNAIPMPAVVMPLAPMFGFQCNFLLKKTPV